MRREGRHRGPWTWLSAASWLLASSCAAPALLNVERTVAQGQAGDPATGYSVGVAVVDITPNPGEIASGCVHLGGTNGPFDPRLGAGVHDLLAIRALVISSGAQSLALASIDATGLDNRLERRIRMVAEAATGIPAPSIVLAATHTHAGSDLQGISGGVCASYAARVVATHFP